MTVLPPAHRNPEHLASGHKLTTGHHCLLPRWDLAQGLDPALLKITAPWPVLQLPLLELTPSLWPLVLLQVTPLTSKPLASNSLAQLFPGARLTPGPAPLSGRCPQAAQPSSSSDRGGHPPRTAFLPGFWSMCSQPGSSLETVSCTSHSSFSHPWFCPSFLISPVPSSEIPSIPRLQLTP